MLRFDIISRLPTTLSPQDVSQTAKSLTRALRLKRASTITVNFVSEAAIQKINEKERKQKHPTDVLSFASAQEVRDLTPSTAEVDLGELVICSTYAAREARRRAIDPREELIRLLVHGVLHIEGYDHAHAEEEARMFALQERLIEEISKA